MYIGDVYIDIRSKRFIITVIGLLLVVIFSVLLLIRGGQDTDNQTNTGDGVTVVESPQINDDKGTIDTNDDTNSNTQVMVDDLIQRFGEDSSEAQALEEQIEIINETDDPQMKQMQEYQLQGIIMQYSKQMSQRDAGTILGDYQTTDELQGDGLYFLYQYESDEQRERVIDKLTQLKDNGLAVYIYQDVVEQDSGLAYVKLYNKARGHQQMVIGSQDVPMAFLVEDGQPTTDYFNFDTLEQDSLTTNN